MSPGLCAKSRGAAAPLHGPVGVRYLNYCCPYVLTSNALRDLLNLILLLLNLTLQSLYLIFAS
jgi:hypothetical protein